MSRLSSRGTKITIAALGPVLAFSLTACGGGSSSSGAAAAPQPTTAPTGAPGAAGGQRGGFGGQDFAKIQACLKAAGVSLPTRSAFPRPTGTFVRPTNFPRPTGTAGFRGRGGAGGAGLFNSPQVKAALAACGITVPTSGFGGGRGPGAGGTPAAQ